MHKNNLGIMDTCSWATPTVEEEVEPPTPEESPIRVEGTFSLDTTVQEGTYHSYHHGCLQRAEGDTHILRVQGMCVTVHKGKVIGILNDALSMPTACNGMLFCEWQALVCQHGSTACMCKHSMRTWLLAHLALLEVLHLLCVSCKLTCGKAV